MSKSTTIDYSIYLVTDSKRNHSSRTLIQTIHEAILGGVKIVQLREKELGDEEFIKLATEIHEVTKQYNVPLIINDRVQVALAIDAEGVHVGSADMPAPIVRKLIGPKCILGVSVETIEQARRAIADGADYIGIQTCFPTPTKTTPNLTVQGHIGIRSILESIPTHVKIKTVAIGGLNEANLDQIVRKSRGQNGRRLDGVAVVTAIVGSEDARLTAATLRMVFEESNTEAIKQLTPEKNVLTGLPAMLTKLRRELPVVYQITNYVSMNDCANFTLAIGGSPIMSVSSTEAKDLVNISGSLVLNIGTLSDPFIQVAIAAGMHANSLCKPIVLDPVGAGASELRRNTTKSILNTIHVDIIKGNAGEIAAISDMIGLDHDDQDVQSKGVDSVGKGFQNPEQIVRSIAKRERCVVAMTGKVDIVSDGVRTISIENGHAIQGQFTGSGCIVASIIASFAAISPGDHFAAAVAGIVCTNLAGEHAAVRTDVHGPGTFRAAFLDEVANLKPENVLRELRVTDIDGDRSVINMNQ